MRGPDAGEAEGADDDYADVEGELPALVVGEGAEDGGAEDEADHAQGEEVGRSGAALAHPVVVRDRGVLHVSVVRECSWICLSHISFLMAFIAHSLRGFLCVL